MTQNMTIMKLHYIKKEKYSIEYSTDVLVNLLIKL